MKILHNEKGIALITSLMFTLLSLVITMALLYMVSTSIRTAGAVKRYRTSTEAAYGGTEIMVKDLITASFAYRDYSAANPGKGFSYYMKNSYMSRLSSPNISDSCFRVKMTTPKSKWPAACSDISTSNIKNTYDVTFNLNAASGTPFAVYSKIIDTMERKFQIYRNHTTMTVTMAGNSDTTTFALEGGSTTDGAGVSVPHYPYMYRIEIQAERQQNPTEKSKISVQYAY